MRKTNSHSRIKMLQH